MSQERCPHHIQGLGPPPRGAAEGGGIDRRTCVPCFLGYGMTAGISPMFRRLGNVAAGMVSLKGYQAAASASAANLKAAAARIQDTDFALETANLTKASVLNQSAMAMVAQANQAQNAILAVIQ